MTLSIIVPVYNVEAYLSRCVDSLLDQGDFTDYEIILVDDGSTDQSFHICEEYAKKDNRVRALQKANGGAASARNFGLSHANGQYVMFVDSDDYIKSNTLELLVKEASENDLDILSFNFVYMYDNCRIVDNPDVVPQTKKILTGPEYLTVCLEAQKMLMSVCKNLYRTSLILDNNVLFLEGKRYEDEEWVPRIFCCAERVSQLDEVIYCYCIRSDSITQDPKSREKGSMDLLSNCYLLKDFCLTITDDRLQNLLENNTATLALSAFFSGRLFEKAHDIKELLQSLHTVGKNDRKKKLFLFSPRLYYLINSTLKKIHH